MADEMAFTTTRPPRRRYLNDEGVARLRPRAKRYTHADPELIGHYVRVLPTGVKSFLTVARDPFGKQVWTTIGVRQESWQRIGGESPPRGRSSQPPRPRVMHEVLLARAAVKRSQGRPRAKY